MPEDTEVSTTDAVEETTATDEALGDGQTAPPEDPFAVFGGEALKVEARRSDAHQGEILAVVRFDSPNTRAPAIQVHVQSANTGIQDNWTIFVPRPFAESTGAFLRRELGIEDLSPGQPDPERPGKMKGNERAQYGMAIKNSAGDASVQQLLSVAAKSGKKPSAEYVAKVQGKEEVTFDEYIAELNSILTGLAIVFSRVAQATEDNPRGFLHVNRVYFPEDVVGNPKMLKRYVRHWETETA